MKLFLAAFALLIACDDSSAAPSQPAEQVAAERAEQPAPEPAEPEPEAQPEPEYTAGCDWGPMVELPGTDVRIAPGLIAVETARNGQRTTWALHHITPDALGESQPAGDRGIDELIAFDGGYIVVAGTTARRLDADGLTGLLRARPDAERHQPRARMAIVDETALLLWGVGGQLRGAVLDIPEWSFGRPFTIGRDAATSAHLEASSDAFDVVWEQVSDDLVHSYWRASVSTRGRVGRPTQIELAPRAPRAGEPLMTHIPGLMRDKLVLTRPTRLELAEGEMTTPLAEITPNDRPWLGRVGSRESLVYMKDGRLSLDPLGQAAYAFSEGVINPPRGVAAGGGYNYHVAVDGSRLWAAWTSGENVVYRSADCP